MALKVLLDEFYKVKGDEILELCKDEDITNDQYNQVLEVIKADSYDYYKIKNHIGTNGDPRTLFKIEDENMITTALLAYYHFANFTNNNNLSTGEKRIYNPENQTKRVSQLGFIIMLLHPEDYNKEDIEIYMNTITINRFFSVYTNFYHLSRFHKTKSARKVSE